MSVSHRRPVPLSKAYRLLNHGPTAATVSVPTDAHDLLADRDVTEHIEVPSLGAAVLRHPARHDQDLLTVTIPSKNIEV